jgi:plasmid stability protein
MARQLTVRGVSDELGQRLEALSRARGESMNATVLEILRSALGVEERRQRLLKYTDWTDEEHAEFQRSLQTQRTIDDDLWS